MKKWKLIQLTRTKKIILLFFLLVMISSAYFYISTVSQYHKWKEIEAEVEEISDSEGVNFEVYYTNKQSDLFSEWYLHFSIGISHSSYMGFVSRLTKYYDLPETISFVGKVIDENSAIVPTKMIEKLPFSKDVKAVGFIELTYHGDVFSFLLKFPDLEGVVIQYCDTSFENIQELSKLKKLRTISFAASPVSDREILVVSKIAGLEYLELSSTKITDESISAIIKLKRLKHLNLAKTKISDAGIQMLAKSHSLEILYLDKTSITDDCIKFLLQMKNLRMLSLYGTKISNEGIKKLTDSFGKKVVTTQQQRFRGS